MAEKIKVAVATDAGGAHLGAYFSALRAIDEVESVALADPRELSFKSAAKTLEGRRRHRKQPSLSRFVNCGSLIPYWDNSCFLICSRSSAG